MTPNDFTVIDGGDPGRTRSPDDNVAAGCGACGATSSPGHKAANSFLADHHCDLARLFGRLKDRLGEDWRPTIQDLDALQSFADFLTDRAAAIAAAEMKVVE